MLDVRIATPEAVMRQAWMTAEEYFTTAIECIDKQFGDDYAKQHPELIGAFMQTAARDYHSTIMKVAAPDNDCAMYNASETISAAINVVAEATSNCATHLKYLGVGDAGTTMGAIEFLAVSIKESGEAIAGAISEAGPARLPVYPEDLPF
jgi:hypothetical protein